MLTQPSNIPARTVPNTTRSRSKSGCKTCRIRRVRCGEERPACQRCVSTGRVCDGYGIWGGGGNAYGQRHRPGQPAALSVAREHARRSLARLRPCHAYPSSALDADEQYHFEWFWRRTARKMSGAFFTDAGNALFYQACTSDSAVTHAILAVCSAHRGLAKAAVVRKPTLPRHEDFALRQYNKAIKYLQRHLRADDAISLRIALFSCLAFIFVELFRGHYRTAACHLEHGLQMLSFAQGRPGSKGFTGRPIDAWALGVFKKLYVQSTLFGQRPRQLWPFGDTLKPISMATTFLDAHAARDYLENILLTICEVIDHQSNRLLGKSAQAHTVKDIEKINQDLDSWFAAYEITLARLERNMDKVEAFACRMLRTYYTMAIIMLDTVCETEESKYDRHTPNFLLIIQQMLDLRKVASDARLRERYFGSEEGMSHSIGDLGTVCPLYYVAVKCRVRRLRIQAIRMLEEAPRKEGIHDTILTANIGRMVMAFEGVDFRDACDEDFGLSESLVAEDLTLEPLPLESERVQILHVILPDGPWNPAMLRCRHRNTTVLYEISQQPSAEGSKEGDRSSS